MHSYSEVIFSWSKLQPEDTETDRCFPYSLASNSSKLAYENKKRNLIGGMVEWPYISCESWVLKGWTRYREAWNKGLMLFVTPSFNTYHISKDSGQGEILLKEYFHLGNLIYNVCMQQFIGELWKQNLCYFDCCLVTSKSDLWTYFCKCWFCSLSENSHIIEFLCVHLIPFPFFSYLPFPGVSQWVVFRTVWKHQLLCC